jgi:hypothetical protein
MLEIMPPRAGHALQAILTFLYHTANGGDPNTLYFTDGIDGETHGLSAALTPAVPEPSSLALLAAALVVGIRRARSRR